MKFETVQIHFLADVFSSVAVVVAALTPNYHLTARKCYRITYLDLSKLFNEFSMSLHKLLNRFVLS